MRLKSFLFLLVISAMVICLSVYAKNETQINIQKLEKLSLKLRQNSIDINNFTLGYDNSGNISMWINLKEGEGLTLGEIDKYNIPRPEDTFYHAYIAKYFLQNFPELDTLLLNTDRDIENTFSIIDRTSYQTSIQSKLPFTKDDFFRSEEIKQMIEKGWYAENGGDFPSVSDYKYVKDYMKNLFGSRLRKIYIGESSSESSYIALTINGLPKGNDMNALNEEISKAFTLSIGRFYNHYWNILSGCNLIYIDSKEKIILKVSMDFREFEKWLDDGLSKDNWFKYCSYLKTYDKQIRFVYKDTNKEKTPEFFKNSYEKIWARLQGNRDIGIQLLGIGDKGIEAVLTMEVAPSVDVYSRQMDIAQQLMEMGVYSVWFIWEENRKMKMIKLDQAKYKVLMFLNAKKKYDFNPAQWSLVATKYWEANEVLK